jgi:oxygen-independent coproporphyrinogen-3 oxidase
VSVDHLYLHLPFCASRCGYCAFVVEVDALAKRDAYLEGLLAELEREEHQLGALRTVYLGGGTPTLMRATRLERLLEAVRPRLADDAEVTIEANPETVDRELLEAIRRAGVTRISLGVQSFRPHLLAALDRAATPDQAKAAVGCAREVGFESVSVDLLLASPGQTVDDLEADLEDTLALDPDHVSWYELEMKPGTSLERMGAPTPDEDIAADMYRRVVSALEDAGYRWYETANFAKPGHECRHSIAYWSAADYLGLGVGAVSTVGMERWRNASGVDRYVDALGKGEDPLRHRETLDQDTRRRERWMLGLRLDTPLELSWAGPPDHPEAVDRLVGAGLLEARDEALVLTREGRFLQNSVLHELMEYA